MRFRYLLFVATLGAALPASAQTSAPELPDPATIRLPDITVGAPEPNSGGDPKYFYFHKAGVSFETAVFDFAECIDYASPQKPARLPGRFMIEEIAPVIPKTAPRPPSTPGASQFGMTGQIIAALIMPGLIRKAHLGGMRICMGYKNYRRYPLSKEAYLALTEKDPASAVFMQAKLASGPTPQGEGFAP